MAQKSKIEADNEVICWGMCGVVWYVYVCVYVRTCIHVYVCMQVWRPEDNARYPTLSPLCLTPLWKALSEPDTPFLLGSMVR